MASNPWDADIPISEELAAKLVRRQFPEFRTAGCRKFGEGFDNLALLVDERVVFRFPRRLIAVRLLEKETEFLPLLAPRLNLPIPLPEWQGEPTTEYPHPFAGYHQLSGVTLCRSGLSVVERNHLAAPLGRFLKQLHAIPLSELPPIDYPFARLRPEICRPHALSRLEELAQKVPDLPVTRLEKILNRPCPGPEETPQALLHGDIYVRHILVDDGKLSGIIDWGDLHTDATARDLMAGWMFDSPGRDEFYQAYGPVAAEVMTLTRFRVAHHTLMLALYANDQQDQNLIRETTAIFHQLVDHD